MWSEVRDLVVDILADRLAIESQDQYEIVTYGTGVKLQHRIYPETPRPSGLHDDHLSFVLTFSANRLYDRGPGITIKAWHFLHKWVDRQFAQVLADQTGYEIEMDGYSRRRVAFKPHRVPGEGRI